jgi:HCOMODA/2-hydroxy-3-carboxy-muconic semialdehyde decarboxylase
MSDPRVEVARGARMLARAGLAHAFGHASVRTGDGGFAISSTRPLFALAPEDVIVVDGGGRVVAGPGDEAPIETPLHRAIYEARAEVAAIARGHPPHAVRWGVGTRDLPLLHGLGALAGRRVPVHPAVELISSPAEAAAAAATLDGGWAMLLRANGALAVGRSIEEAAARLWFLEDRARVALGAVAEDDPITVAVWERRELDVQAELRRAVDWFTARFGDRRDGRTSSEPAPTGDPTESRRGDGS